jgi:hypothetical protein
MVLPLSVPPAGCFGGCGPEETKNLAGGNALRLIRIRLAMPSVAKISPACQGNSAQVQTAASSSTNAVSFSSARTMNRFPLSR